MTIRLSNGTIRAALVAAMATTLTLTACGAAGNPSQSPLATDSPEPSTSDDGTAVVVPARPNDIPTDGGCDENRRCFGVLQPGSYQTEFLDPNFSFEIAGSGWVNTQSSGGELNLLSLESPGDELVFLQRATARSADGERVAGVGATAAEMSTWFASRTDLMATGADPVSIGGLGGLTFDITVLPDASPTLRDCPAEPCVMLIGGKDPAEMPSWVWDLALWRGAAMRIWLLDAEGQVVALQVTAWDGSQLEELVTRVQPIIDSITFTEGG
jgi:hypothetical protein